MTACHVEVLIDGGGRVMMHHCGKVRRSERNDTHWLRKERCAEYSLVWGLSRVPDWENGTFSSIVNRPSSRFQRRTSIMSEQIPLASFLSQPLAQCDPEMYELIRKEKQRQVCSDRRHSSTFSHPRSDRFVAWKWSRRRTSLPGAFSRHSARV